MEYTGKPFEKIKNEGKLFTIAALIKVAEYEKENKSLNPSGITYDIHGDVVITGETAEDFLTEYKALVGFGLQDRYTFANYFEGGLSLLKKDEILKKVFDASNVEDVVVVLKEEYDKEYAKTKEGHVLVKKSKMTIISVLAMAFAVLFIGAITYISVERLGVGRIEKANISGITAFLNKDYEGCINAYKEVSESNLNSDAKYVLSISYVKCENLTQEQKDNIVDEISNVRLEMMYNYWIDLNRNNYSRAEDTAMALANDELLLYAYMKEATYLKNNTGLNGEEKNARIKQLQSDIDRLSKAYEEKE